MHEVANPLCEVVMLCTIVLRPDLQQPRARLQPQSIDLDGIKFVDLWPQFALPMLPPATLRCKGLCEQHVDNMSQRLLFLTLALPDCDANGMLQLSGFVG